MSYLYLIRHSYPEKDTSIPASQWRLSHQGREACKSLAEKLAPNGLTVLISSLEPKAVETAQLTAKILGIPSRIAFGLHEQDRSNIGYLPSQEQFYAKVKELMEKPDEHIFGNESANQAHLRFSLAIKTILSEYQDEIIGLVTHGTVMSLFTACENNLDPFEFWQSLEMPHIIKLSIPDYQIIKNDK